LQDQLSTPGTPQNPAKNGQQDGCTHADNPVLELKELTIQFSGKSVLRHITLAIESGETLAIVGESGSGKSLTALSLLHLLPRQADVSGRILLTNIDGQNNQYTDITFLDDRSMQDIRGAQIGMIFQEPMTSLNPVKTCGDQVMEAILTHHQATASGNRNQAKNEARQQVLQLFKDVRLPEPEQIFHKYPHQISGGQKQRVMIAMAMSCQPRLLICDEPTTALDVLVQKEIIQLIHDLQRKNNMSVLFISHDIQLVAATADQIAVLYKGDLVETGPAAQIMEHPQHPYTKALLACRPGLYAKGQRLPVVSDFLNTPKEQQPTIPVLQASEAAASKEKLPTADHPALLEIKNLNVWYPTHFNFWGRPTGYYKAVKDLNLEIQKGETLGLVGGSGCGKTTLGRAVMGLTPIHQGSIMFKGEDIHQSSLSKKDRARQLQMIFQDPYSALNPRIPIGQAIGEALQIHHNLSPKIRKERVCEWLEKVGLTAEHYHRYPHEFSGGQRQRIVIARALIVEPDFIICDESVSALDVSVQAQVLNLLNDLKAELGFTCIFISHDLSVVRYISDRIAVMQAGQIAELGDADQIYYRPSAEYTKQLLSAIP